VRGSITSHRARSTVASQTYNAREPMTVFESQLWLGHSNPHSTQHYAKITPLKIVKSYGDAGYFARNLRPMEVLVDQEVVRTDALQPSRESFIILATAIAPMTSLNSASTAWPAPSVISTYRNSPRQLCYWRAKRIYPCVRPRSNGRMSPPIMA
jgi:hypothetical protein